MKNITPIINCTKTFFTLIFLLFNLLVFSQSPKTYTSSSTFTVPVGVTMVTVEAWGGGGAGGGATTATGATGGGGGGGAYNKVTNVAVTPGQIITVTIGSGGTAVSGGNGGNGGTTTFASTIPVTANGGTGGTAGVTGTLIGAGGTGGIGVFNGGAGGTGNATTSGGGGGGAGNTGSGAAGTTVGGGGGTGSSGATTGGSGRDGKDGSSNGEQASNLSAGGSGARNNITTARPGGNGYRGQIILTWTVGTPEMNIKGNVTSIPDGNAVYSPTDYTDFGSTNTGTAVSRTYTIENTGTGTLTLGTVTLGDNTNYTVTTSPSATVAAGGTTTFTVTFNPTTAGAKNTTISIDTNDSNENPYNFGITGTGVAVPEINITGNSVTILDGSATASTSDHTDFGSTNTGFGITKTYTIKNSGGASLSITGVSLSDAVNYSYSFTGGLPFAVTAGSTKTFTVTFNPTSAGVKPATVTITNNDANEASYDFEITGTGQAAPEINIVGNSISIPDGNTGYSTTDYTHFGLTVPTGTPVTYTYTVENTGTGSLTLGAVTLGNTTDYSFTFPAITSVPAGTSTTFTITFNPTTAGVKNTTFSIVTNDTGENPYNFGITGTGVAFPEINIQGNGTSINSGNTSPIPTNGTDFGSIDYISGTIVKTFTIQNTGGSNLTIGTASLSGSSDFTITTAPVGPVAATGTTTIIITFDPSSLGTKNATVSIVNGDSDENPYTFAIQGNGNQTFYDSDGDGVNDNLDNDDDNDGITDSTEETNCSAANGTKSNYKFLNETFGTGGRTTINTTYAAETTYCYEDGIVGTNIGSCTAQSNYSVDDGEYTVSSTARVSHWSDGTTNTKWYQGDDHTSGDTNGRMAIFNASPTAGQIFYTATITGALPDIPITYSFWALNLDRLDEPNIATRTRPNIKVEFIDLNGNVLQTINTGDIAPSGLTPSTADWHQYTANLILSVNAFKVVFTNNNGNAGSGNDLAMDDISITQTLCDYDNDGVADLFDLDSDNDGITDVAEAGLSSLSNGKGKIDITWVDANANGIHDSAEATAALASLDSDSDGIPNYLDLDSDNDSVFDVDEGPINTTPTAVAAGFTNGDGDITGDGKGDGVDSEAFRSKDTDGNGTLEYYGDGILDLYDYGTGGSFANQYGNSGQGAATGNTNTDYLKDTDGDGIPDYLDSISDGVNQDITLNKTLYGLAIDLDGDGIVGLSSIYTDADKDGILDAFDTNTTAKGSPRDLNKSLFLNFDGRNDYAQSTAILGGLSNASLMAWISLNPAFASEGVVMGQNNFQIRITATGNLEAVVNNGTPLSFGTVLNVSQWYHVAATFNGTNLKLYLNGKLVGTQAIAGSINADTSLFTIGRDPASILPAGIKYFKGKIDEVRVFNVGLTDNQVQRMVYQELDPNSINLKGTYITAKEIDQNLTTSTGTLTFSNMLRYYRMDGYKDDILDDLTTTAIDLTGTKLYNHKNIYLQQAPMPFVTTADGDLATAVTNGTYDIAGINLTRKDIQGTDVNIYSTIVNVKHLNTSTIDRTDTGLIIDTGKSLTVNGDSGLTNTWWLSLNGKIDLEGKSQLVQTSTSDLDVTSAGSIERDQQGVANIYNYNYWSSPVSSISAATNNHGYFVGGVMKDGFNTIYRNITWTGGYNGVSGNASTPVSLARYWLYKFESNAALYANWVQINENSLLRAGQGYTLKGSGAVTNFTFVGKPNNGTITTNTVAPNQLLLVGNPYPSALDGFAFINDNINSIDRFTTGTLYFWEHATNNNSHNLADYLGGYAALNLTGGIGPVVPAGGPPIAGSGTSSGKTPNQYIPVGQGFFVVGKPSGSGPVIFNNAQRAFIKEDHADSNPMFKTKATSRIPSVISDSETKPTPKYKKIRLGYDNNSGYHRQVLIGFMDDKATSGIDYGYDATIMDSYGSDMFLLNGTKKLVIAGESYFDTNAIYPIGVKAKTEGKVSFNLDSSENFDEQQPIFIHDNVTDAYHNIREAKFEIVLPAGSNNTRFSLRFKDKTLAVDDNEVNENTIKVSHIQKGNILEINNQSAETAIEKVSLYNSIGQFISSWEIENSDQKETQISLKSVSTGVYIVKIKTSKGDIIRKIIIK